MKPQSKAGQNLAKLTWEKIVSLTWEYQDIEGLKKHNVEDLPDVSVVDANILAATDCEIVLSAIAAELKRRDTLGVVEDKRSLAAASKEVNGRKARLVTIRGYLATQRSKLQARRGTPVVATNNLGPRDDEDSSPSLNGLSTSRLQQKDSGEDSSSSHPPSSSAATGGNKSPVKKASTVTAVLSFFVTVVFEHVNINVFWQDEEVHATALDDEEVKASENE